MYLQVPIIDGDGHVLEDFGAIARFLPPAYRSFAPEGAISTTGIFPPLDHLHTGNFVGRPDINERLRHHSRVEDWMRFLEDVGIRQAVLYPTAGLACGKISDPEWACAATAAYNDWLHATYIAASPRFKGMALLPMQDPAAAAAELRRAVDKLGMCGGMIPSNGLKSHLGSKEFYPVYEAANELGCTLAVHGGCHDGFGFDDLNVFAAAHALGHPFGIMIGFAGMLFNGVFDAFPNVRFAFLEAGVATFLTLLERCHGSYKAFPKYNAKGELPRFLEGKRVADHIVDLTKNGRLFIGCEGDEPSLAYASRVFGSGPFIYSSDFPHEVTTESCKEEIEELLDNEDLSEEARRAILHDNVIACYRLDS